MNRHYFYLIMGMILLASISCQSNKNNQLIINDIDCLSIAEMNNLIQQVETTRELLEKVPLECLLAYCDTLSNKSIEQPENENPVKMASNLCRISDGAVSEALSDLLFTLWQNQTYVFANTLFQLNQDEDTCLQKLFLQSLAILKPFDTEPYKQIEGLGLSGDVEYFLFKNSPNCLGLLPSLDIIIDHPDTVLNHLESIELGCIETLLKNIGIQVLQNEDAKSYHFLEKCSENFDASYSTLLGGYLKNFWLSQESFFLNQVVKSKRTNLNSIPDIIITELALDLGFETDLENKLIQMNKKVDQLDLTKQEKLLIKKINIEAIDRFKKRSN